jgi:hypothetical protein
VHLYWTYNSIPELADLPKEKRKELWHACHLKVFVHWQIWVSLLVCGLCAATGTELGKFYYNHIGGFLGAMLGGGIGGFIVGQVGVAVTRPHIREYLNSHEKTN